jgi:hypothetical protein
MADGRRRASIGFIFLGASRFDFLLKTLWCPMFDILAASLLVLYFIPMANAHDQAHPNAVMISLLNVFLGWTLIGWIVAFVWAKRISPVEFYVAKSGRIYA